MSTAQGVCLYSLAHKLKKVPSTTIINCGPVGLVPACQACADFYARMKSETTS